jgi:hypothetical protein
MTRDPNMKTLYEWASRYPSFESLSPRMKVGELIEIVDKVNRCLGREFEKDKDAYRRTHGRDPRPEEEPFILVPCQDYSQGRKEEFLNCIERSVGEMPLLIDEEYLLNVALRMWSGCLATAKTLSIETQSGLNTEETRRNLICEIDDIAKKDAVYRKGEEIACIWQQDPRNVSFDGVSPNSYARKYEGAWSKRHGIRSDSGSYNNEILSEEIWDSEESGLGDQAYESESEDDYGGDIGRIASAGTRDALREYSRNTIVNAITTITDFSKSMIALVSGFFVAYFALLKFLGLGVDDITKQTLIDPFYAGTPALLFIISIISFIISNTPSLREPKSTTDQKEIQKYRKFIWRIKYGPMITGVAAFVTGLAITLHISIQLLF